MITNDQDLAGATSRDAVTRAEAAKKLQVRKSTLIAALAAFPKGGGKNAPAVKNGDDV